MIFDWLAFLSQHGIEYVERGRNISLGEIGINCPLCAGSDPSHHMAINLSGAGWYCRRDQSHRGKHPAELVRALLGCSHHEAQKIIGDAAPSITDDVLIAEAKLLSLRYQNTRHREHYDLPVEFLKLRHEAGPAKPFFHALAGRGYSGQQVARIAEQYDLRYALRGMYAYRIIIPAENEFGVVSFTGRTILSGDDVQRYMAQRSSESGAKLHSCLFQHRALADTTGAALVVCEGPFDAIRVDFIGKEFGVRATCLFGKALSLEQTDLLTALRNNYDRVILMLDRSAWIDSVEMAEKLSFLDVVAARCPQEEPELLSAREIKNLLGDARQ